jgi:hypothetical protein
MLDFMVMVEYVHCHSQAVTTPKLDVLVVFLHSGLNGQLVSLMQTWPHL